MRIGIDVSQIVFRGTGVATYTENLIKSLLKIDRENEYVFFFSSLRKKPPAGFVSKNFRLPPIALEFLWNQVHLLPIERLVGKVDVFHTSDWLEPPARCPKVTTIHDLAVYKYPETLHPRIISNQRRKLDWVKKESKLIIAVSENTKRDIVEILGIPSAMIRVVYEAADEVYSKPAFAKATARQATNNIGKIKKKYGIEGDYLLAVGTREPRKNLERVIEAFSQMTGLDPVSLVIVGKFGWGEDINNLKFKIENLKLLGYVPKEDLASLYSGAECFVYPSLYEGFGLPILEAMASGCPVVTSNISSMPEVAGKAAVLVNPESVEDVADGIKKAIKNRKDLIEKGFARAKEFSWEKTARETLKVYQEVYAHRN